MKLLEKKIYACGHEEIIEVETPLQPETHLIKINEKDGFVAYDQKRCRLCWRAARDIKMNVVFETKKEGNENESNQHI